MGRISKPARAAGVLALVATSTRPALAAEPRIALIEEVIPDASYGARLPEPLLAELVEGFERAAKAKLVRGAASAAPAPGPPDASAPALLAAYANALAEIDRPNLAEAHRRLYKLQDLIQSDARLYLRNPLVVDALADAYLLLADIDLRADRLEEAKVWLRSYVMTFPVREPDAGRYRAEVLKRLGEMRTSLRSLGGGRAVLRAPGPTWSIHVNGAVVGRGEARIAWLHEDTYYAFAAEGERAGPVVDLVVWNGKEARLDLPAPPPALEDRRVRRFSSREELSAWDEDHAENVTRFVEPLGAGGAVVLRVLGRTWTSDGLWRGAGWTVGAWVIAGGKSLGWSAVTIPGSASEEAGRADLRRFGAELGEGYRAAKPGKGSAPEPPPKGDGTKKTKKGKKER